MIIYVTFIPAISTACEAHMDIHNKQTAHVSQNRRSYCLTLRLARVHVASVAHFSSSISYTESLSREVYLDVCQSKYCPLTSSLWSHTSRIYLYLPQIDILSLLSLCPKNNLKYLFPLIYLSMVFKPHLTPSLHDLFNWRKITNAFKNEEGDFMFLKNYETECR